MTATETLQQIQTQVEEIKSDETQRFPEAASAGDTFRQGDLYIERLEVIPANCKEDKNAPLQLAPGTTKGSRHILDGRDGVTIYQLNTPTALEGPLLRTTKDRTVTHPEHGNVVLPPGDYQVTYQRAYADELRRVAD